MGRGRPVRLRERGYIADITSIGRMRTALKIDPRLDKNKVAAAVATMDRLIEQLCDIDKDIENSGLRKAM
jgi:hypothetical protein